MFVSKLFGKIIAKFSDNAMADAVTLQDSSILLWDLTISFVKCFVVSIQFERKAVEL